MGGSAGAYTASVQTSLHGTVVTPDLSGSNLDIAFTTPGGSVTGRIDLSQPTQFTTKVGQNTDVRPLSIASSSDAAVPASGSGESLLYGSAVGLSYTNFGTWSLKPCAYANSCTPAYVGVRGGANLGQAPTASMPTTGSATFTGGATGYVFQPVATNSKNAGQFYGDSSITANFATGAVTGSITGINAYKIEDGTTLLGTVNSIGFTGTISGAEYSGNANVTGPGGTAFDIAGATGSVKGGFFGPSAAETAGALYLSGGANSTELVGSFGAKQAASDRRLKEDLVPISRLPNGLQLYSWRYLGGTRKFVGLIAQDLVEDGRFAAAVKAESDGLLTIDYTMVGYMPADFEAMQAEGARAAAEFRKVH